MTTVCSLGDSEQVSRKYFSLRSVVQHWNRIPGDDMEVYSLSVFHDLARHIYHII